MMNTPENPIDLLDFFKALGDAERLKIAGLLANQSLSLSELAQRANLKPGDVAKHLDQLESQQLIIRDGDHYRLATKSIEQKARAVLAQARPKVKAEDFEGEAYDRKILSDYMTPDGKLKQIPSQQKKLLVILRHLVKQFQAGQRYPEKQVNATFLQYHEDYAALRRYMIDNQLMARENGEYWVVEPPSTSEV